MNVNSQFLTSNIQDTLIAVWAGEPTAARLSDMVQSLKVLHAVYPEGVYLYNLVTTRAGMPNKAARDLMAKQFDSMRGKLKAAAIVLEHSGVQYTLSRTIIGTLATITRNPFALKIFDKRDAAAQWLSSQSRASAASIVTLAADIEAQMSASGVLPAAQANAKTAT